MEAHSSRDIMNSSTNEIMIAILSFNTEVRADAVRQDEQLLANDRLIHLKDSNIHIINLHLLAMHLQSCIVYSS